MSADTATLGQFNDFVIRFTTSFAAIFLLLFSCVLLGVNTPTSKRWSRPFNLAFSLLLVGILYFFTNAMVFYYVFPISADPASRFGFQVATGIFSNLYLLIGEISLAWMVKRIYSHRKFRIILPIIIFFIALRLAFALWFLIEFLITETAQRALGIVFSVLVMVNCVVFSSLFIYPYRRKLRNSVHTNRFLHTVLSFSIRNAIIPTILVIFPIVTLLLPKSSVVTILDTLAIFLFRVAYGTLIAYSLYLINSGQDRSNNNTSNGTQYTNTFHHIQQIQLNLVSSFGVERRTETIIENFLSKVYDMFGGDIGYFVEKNRFGQMAVICGFSFDKDDSGVNVSVFHLDDSTEESDIPKAALEYALSFREVSVTDFALDTKENSLSEYLGGRVDLLDSVLILPVTSPGSPKRKILYIERHQMVNSSHQSVDSFALELLAQQFATSLECARLFGELESEKRELDKKVKERTKELECKNRLLETAKDEALKAASAKSVFLSNMSHEIRTPLSQAIAAAQLLADTNLTPEGKEYASIIINSGQLLLSLVNDILDSSKLENGKVVLETIEFDLFHAIQISVDAFTVDKDVRIAYYIPRDFDHVVLGDGTRIRQIITNLVSNSIKFTESGFVLVYLTSTRLSQEAVKVEFKIIDTGIGIAKEKQSRIFERFEQENESITRNHGGTGLGLSICRDLCTLMGSDITVHSELGQGSTFEFRIQFKLPTTKSLSSPSDLIHVLKSSPKILLLEDARYIYNSKSILQHQLETLGSFPHRVPFSEFSGVSGVPPVLDMIVMDVTTFDDSRLLSFLNHSIFVLTKSRIPMLLICTAPQRNLVQSDSTFSLFSTNLHILPHPYKQSLLYRVIKKLLDTPTATEPSNHGIKPPMIDDSVRENRLDRPLSILLAEDNLVNQKVFTTVLSKFGYQTDVAENGQIAVDMVKRKHYDLIFMDMRMPVMGGIESTQKIRSYYDAKTDKMYERVKQLGIPSAQSNDSLLNVTFSQENQATPLVPFIVGLSADALSENKQEGLTSGMNMYLSKPVSKDILYQVLQTVGKTVS